MSHTLLSALRDMPLVNAPHKMPSDSINGSHFSYCEKARSVKAGSQISFHQQLQKFCSKLFMPHSTFPIYPIPASKNSMSLFLAKSTRMSSPGLSCTKYNIIVFL